MKILFRLFSIAVACLSPLFALFAVGTLLRTLKEWSLTNLFLAVSLLVTAVLIARAAVWLWFGPGFWRVRYRRAEVFAVPALVVGLLGAMYYTPASGDPHAVAKFIACAEGFALFVYLVVLLTFGTSKDVAT